MQGGGRGVGLNGPLVCSREAAATSLGWVFCHPEGLGDPKNILRGRECSLQLSPAQLVTVGAQQGGPQDPQAGVPAPAQSQAADSEGHRGQGIEGVGSRLLQPLHTVISFTSLASLGSITSHCNSYIPLHSLNALQLPHMPCIINSLLQPFKHPLHPLRPLPPSQLTEFISRCILCVPCSLLCHLHPVHALHSPLAAHGPCTQLPAKPTHFSLIQGHSCL